MALINCPDCGKEISDLAPFCPNCGRPIATASSEEKNTINTSAVEVASEDIINKTDEVEDKENNLISRFINWLCDNRIKAIVAFVFLFVIVVVVVVTLAGRCDRCSGSGLIECTKCVNGKITCTNESCNKGKVTCSECEGKKIVDCENCKGKGFQLCSDCSGNGEIYVGMRRCFTCGGNGTVEVTCSNCKGFGWVYANLSPVKCTRCGGTGKGTPIECFVCRGSGQCKDFDDCETCDGSGVTDETCSACNGKKTEPCKNCSSSGVVDCSICKGTSKINCEVCKGTKHLRCPDCSGTGKKNNK